MGLTWVGFEGSGCYGVIDWGLVEGQKRAERGRVKEEAKGQFPSGGGDKWSLPALWPSPIGQNKIVLCELERPSSPDHPGVRPASF